MTLFQSLSFNICSISVYEKHRYEMIFHPRVFTFPLSELDWKYGDLGSLLFLP